MILKTHFFKGVALLLLKKDVSQGMNYLRLKKTDAHGFRGHGFFLIEGPQFFFTWSSPSKGHYGPRSMGHSFHCFIVKCQFVTKFQQFKKICTQNSSSLRSGVSHWGGLVCCIIRMGHHQTDLWLGDEVGLFLEGKLMHGLLINHQTIKSLNC